jgi:hypothetical protein
MQDSLAGLFALILHKRTSTADAQMRSVSLHEARDFLLSADALLRPRPVLCAWFADVCAQHADHLPHHIRFLSVAVVLSCTAELPLCILDAAKGLLCQCDLPSRDVLSLLHWKCIISVAGVLCLLQPPVAAPLTVLCDNAADRALAACVSETISVAAAVKCTTLVALRPPSGAVLDWARMLIFQAEDRAHMFAWLHRCGSEDSSSGSNTHDFIAACSPCVENGQISCSGGLSSPLLSMHTAPVTEASPAVVAVRTDIKNALRGSLQSLSAVAMSHRTSCTMRQFVSALCECLNAEAQSTRFDVSSTLPAIFDVVDLAHDTSLPECPGITLPLARTLAGCFGSSADVWRCVHSCMLGTVASGRLQVAAADVGVVLMPPAPLARLTHHPGPVDASVHACWAYACSCMQQQLDVDLGLLPSTLACLARTCNAAAVGAALLCRAGQWLCMCNASRSKDGASNCDDELLSRCIDAVMTTLQTLTSATGTPAMTFLSQMHDAWRSAVSSAIGNDDAVLDCVPSYLLLLSHAAGRSVFSNVYGPNIAADVTALIAAALSMVPRLQQLLSGWMVRCGFDSACTLFVSLRDSGIVSGPVSQAPSHSSVEPTCHCVEPNDNGCPRTPPRSDKTVASPLVYRLAYHQSPQKLPSAASPLHKSTLAMLDRVLQRFSDDPSSLPADAAKFSQQVKSLDSWRLMVAAVAAPQSCTWAASNIKIRCRFVHALIGSSLPGTDAALPHLAAWIVGADRRIELDVLHSIVTTWARSSALLDCHAFCLWALRQAQASPGVLSSFQSLHKATVILQPMLHAPSMLSAMSSEIIANPVSVTAAGRMLALVFASGYSLDSLLEHRSELSFGFFDDSYKMLGGDAAAAALSSDAFGYLSIHGVVGAALVILHEDDAIASLLLTSSPETRRIMTHRICFHVLRCLSLTSLSLNRCKIPMLLSLASAMARDLPLVAEQPENSAAAERLLKMCSILLPPNIQHGEEAVQLLRRSRCDFARSSVENVCSSFFSDASVTSCTHGAMSSAWDASWLASLIAACGHQWEMSGTERVLSLLRLQLQLGCAPDTGVCASLPDSLMLRSAVSLMQQQPRLSSVQHTANIALQIFCRRASPGALAFSANTSDGLDVSASLASLCATFCEADCLDQLSLLLCLVTCDLMQQLQLKSVDPIDTLTKFFDEYGNKSCWRGVCIAASRSNLALAAAAGFSSGAVLIAQLLHISAPFAAALPLLQSAPAYAFAAFSPQIVHERKEVSTVAVKVERCANEETKFKSEVEMRQPSMHSTASPRTSSGTDFAETCVLDHSAANNLSETKRRLVMQSSADRSPTSASDARTGIFQDADSKCINAPALLSLLPKKRAEPSLSPAAVAKLLPPDQSLPNDLISVKAGSSKKLSWLAQLRAQQTTSDYQADEDILQDVKCDPVQAASPAVLRIASAAAERRIPHEVPAGLAAGTLQQGKQLELAHNLNADGGSDDDIVALS